MKSSLLVPFFFAMTPIPCQLWMFKTYLGRDSALAGEEVRRLLNQVEKPYTKVLPDAVRAGPRCACATGMQPNDTADQPHRHTAVHRLPEVSDDQDLAPPPGKSPRPPATPRPEPLLDLLTAPRGRCSGPSSSPPPASCSSPATPSASSRARPAPATPSTSGTRCGW